ncbi:hypothetical protein EON79_02340 [bacterium]|nr:MAG: hypothetical protein EON79_02340 [bacterium]
MKRTLLVAMSFVAAVASAQNLPLWWNQSTNTNDTGDQTVATAFDGLNNLYVLSQLPNAGNSDGLLVKYDNKGLETWRRTINVSNADVVNAMTIDTLGNVIIVGSTASGANTNLLLVTVTPAGVVSAFSKAPPVSAIRGYSVTTDATGIYVGSGVVQAGQEKPYVIKYSTDGSTETWRSGLTSRSGNLSQIAVNTTSGRVYFAGNLTSSSSVVVGYVSTAGGAITSQLPTSASSTFEKLTKALFVGDRIIWTGYSATNNAGTTGVRGHYGQYDFSDTPGGFEVTESTATGNVGTDVAYDATSGAFAFQTANAGNTTIDLRTVDTSNDTFVAGASYGHVGHGVGIVPVTMGYFASYAQAGGLQTAYLVDPGTGVVASTEAGPGTVALTANGIPSAPQRPVSSLERATAVGGASATGARVHSLSFIAGPADDSRRLKEDTTYTFNVLLNDPGLGTKTVGANTLASNGSVSVSADGTLVYTPAANWYGVDTLTYDEYVNGSFFATRTVTLTVLNVVDGPTAVDDAVGQISNSAFTTLTLSVLSNDLNPDGIARPIRFLSVTQPGNGTVTLSNNKSELKIKAAPGAAGQAFSFTYTIQNGTGFTSTATVTGTFAP